MKVGLYIYINDVARKLELFKDEKISVTSLVKDLGDINKIYTDYSKSFTIPASKKNNDILSHWYENSIEDGFDQRVKAEGYIEINTIPFREGLWQLEASEIKDNKIKSYSLTFFGNLKTFVDIIGEDKIEDLDFGFIDTPFNDATVVDRVKGDSPDAAVQFPLISNKDFWVKDLVTPENTPFNISLIDVIKFNNLPPAVSVDKIFEAIETDYGITFSGGFLNTLFFKRLYLYFKNGEEYLPTLKLKTLNFSTFSETGTTPITYVPIGDSFQYDSEGLDAYNSDVILNITPSDLNQPYTIFVNRTNPNTPLFRYDVPIGGNSSITNILGESLPGGNNNQSAGTYYFEITSPAAMSFSGTIVYTGQTLGGTAITSTITIPSQTLVNTIDLNQTAPDMRIVDLISGLVKAFNLVIIPKGNNEYSFETLEKYYELGRLRDLTQYAETSNKIERIKVFNKVDFKYQESGTIINTAFRDLLDRDYADLESDFNGDGGQFTVQLPFETLKFLNMPTDAGGGSLTGIEMGYNITPDIKPYKNKPILLYRDKIKNITIGANINVAGTAINEYLAFGNQTDVGVNTFTLNFGIENSIDTNQPLFNSLYQTYYSAYLNNIYDKKARKIKIKMRLPLSIITSLELNDRIIIRDKSYLINSFTNELTTGETSMELVQNFRPVAIFLSRSERFDSLAKTEVFDVPQLDDDTTFPPETQNFSTIVFDAGKKQLTISVTENTTKDTRIDLYRPTSGDIQQDFYIIQNGE